MIKILELQLQHQSFQWIFRVDLPLHWLVWSPCHPRDIQESSPATPFKGINSLGFCLLYSPAITTVHDHSEDHSFDYMDLFHRVMPPLFNTLSRFVIAFLPRSNCLLISWLQSPSIVILEPKKRKSVTTSTFSPSICHAVMGPKTVETVSDFIFLGSKITADGDGSHEVKRHLLFGRKVVTNLDSILKSRDITLSTKVRLVKAMVFPVAMYGCESWTVKKAECWRIDAF